MTVDSAEQLSHVLAPWLEALLMHERVIVPSISNLRMRALDKALASVLQGRAVPVTQRFGTSWKRIAFGSATGFLLLTSVGLASLAGSRPASRSAITLPLDRPSTRVEQPAAESETPPPPLPMKTDPEENPNQGLTAESDAETEHQASLAGPSEPDSGELGMLERAQRSEARGEFLTVLTLVAEHERSYPASRLGEEREILRFRALVGMKRGHEARRVVRKFHRDFPHSVFLTALDEMLAAAR
jgi:hypothetical protein